MKIWSSINLPWDSVMSHKKFGPDRFSRFDVYWIQTNRQTDRQAKFIYRCYIIIVSLWFYLFFSFLWTFSISRRRKWRNSVLRNWKVLIAFNCVTLYSYCPTWLEFRVSIRYILFIVCTCSRNNLYIIHIYCTQKEINYPPILFIEQSGKKTR